MRWKHGTLGDHSPKMPDTASERVEAADFATVFIFVRRLSPLYLGHARSDLLFLPALFSGILHPFLVDRPSLSARLVWSSRYLRPSLIGIGYPAVQFFWFWHAPSSEAVCHRLVLGF